MILRKFNYLIWSSVRKKYSCKHLHRHIATSGYGSYNREMNEIDYFLYIAGFENAEQE